MLFWFKWKLSSLSWFDHKWVSFAAGVFLCATKNIPCSGSPLWQDIGSINSTTLMARNGNVKSYNGCGSYACLKSCVWPLRDRCSVRCSNFKTLLCLHWQGCRVGVAVCFLCLRQQPALTAVVVIEGSPQVSEDWDDLVGCWGCCRGSTSSTRHMHWVWMSCWDEDLSWVATAQTVGPMCSGQLGFFI